MLKNLTIRNFTAFAEADLDFASGGPRRRGRARTGARGYRRRGRAWTGTRAGRGGCRRAAERRAAVRARRR